MVAEVVNVLVEPPYKLCLTFRDGTSGVVDMASELANAHGVFVPLRDPAFFARVTVDQEFGTVVWPNDVDLDSDVLYLAARDGISIEEAIVRLGAAYAEHPASAPYRGRL